MIVLLILSAAVAQEIVEPKLVEELKATVQDSGTVTIVDGSAYEISLNLTVPQSTSNQDVSSFVSRVVDDEGNEFAAIHETDPPNPFDYSALTQVFVRARKTQSLPDSYEVPQDYARYAKPTPQAQSDSQRIRELAESITANATSDFERLALLSIWVHENVEYDASLIGQKRDALWTLDNNRGVCVEYSSLLIAMARSIGYPARYVLGQSYGNYGWLGHAWAEVFLGEWVPVDPTWMEAGSTDATHIEFFRSADSSAESKVFARVTSNARMEWDKHEFAGEKLNQTQIVVQNISYASEDSGYVLGFGSTTLGFGDTSLVFLAVNSTDYRVVDARLVTCSGGISVIEVANPSQYLILEPGKQSVVAWLVTTLPGLDPTLVYTCPLTLNSDALQEQKIDVKVQKGAESRQLMATIARTRLRLGGTQTVLVESKAGGSVGLITKDFYELRPSSGGTTEFAFDAIRPGRNDVYAFSSDGGVKQLSFDVEEAEGEVFISDISVSPAVRLGDPVVVRVDVENKRAEPESLEVYVGEQSRKLKLTGKESLVFQLSFDEAGEHAVPVRVVAGGAVDEQEFIVVVIKPPTLSVLEPEFIVGDEGTTAVFSVSPSEGARSVSVSVSGQEKLVEGGSASFVLAPGTYAATVTWQDALGNAYSKDVLVNVPGKTPSIAFGSIWVLAGGVLVFSLLVVLLVVVIVARRLLSTAKKKEPTIKRSSPTALPRNPRT